MVVLCTKAIFETRGGCIRHQTIRIEIAHHHGNAMARDCSRKRLSLPAHVATAPESNEAYVAGRHPGTCCAVDARYGIWVESVDVVGADGSPTRFGTQLGPMASDAAVQHTTCVDRLMDREFGPPYSLISLAIPQRPFRKTVRLADGYATLADGYATPADGTVASAATSAPLKT
ncbi:hypothetical protein DFH06DRAFT_1136237 [Mycena polygramma]|nr:hypothetical protein DFH06DRAFT_1136237 [Mycena polygramma]